MEAIVVEAVHHHNRRLDPCWEENCRAFVEEKLKDVKTNAQVIILLTIVISKCIIAPYLKVFMSMLSIFFVLFREVAMQ